MAGKFAGIEFAGKKASGITLIRYPDKSQSTTRKELHDFAAGQAFPVHIKAHMNINTLDEDGEEIQHGDPRLEGVYVDSFSSNERVATLNQTGDESKNPAGGRDDHGCTPIIVGQGEGEFNVRSQGMVKDATGVAHPVGEEITSATFRLA